MPGSINETGLLNYAGFDTVAIQADHPSRESIRTVIAEGGSDVTVSSQSGHRMPALTPEEDLLLDEKGRDRIRSINDRH